MYIIFLTCIFHACLVYFILVLYFICLSCISHACLVYYMLVLYNITSAGAVDREFFDILTPSGMSQSSPRPSQSSPRAPPDTPKATPGPPGAHPEARSASRGPWSRYWEGPSSQVRCGRTKSSFWELPALPAAASGSALSGGMDCGSGPPYHTRRGSG